MKFGGVWILHLDVLEFRFYPLKFRVGWILHPQILKLHDVKSKHSQTLGSKIKTPQKFRG